ncbi:hypothetical protein EAF04_007048 [Stromatinia cepivora]|nr:hypothetical protein EAF04_007048 [Stromatinia cepivora]
MASTAEMNLEPRARELVDDVMQRLTSSQGISSMSPSIYDTAWVSMISKCDDGVSRWLFPEAFRYLLERQSQHGGWGENSTQSDAILNTLAAQLAMMRHRDVRALEKHDDLVLRIDRAPAPLRESYQAWDVRSGLHISAHGFEQEEAGKVRHNMLYGKQETTLVHSLEAFVGKIDFNRVRHHAVGGSMMASPASTAAYLMYSSSWDDAAEVYIRNCISNGPGQGSGGVPSAFPTTIFEITWIFSALLESGISSESLSYQASVDTARFLESQLVVGNGTLGFGPPGLMSDSDDTAKGLLTLNLLGHRANPTLMISQFESTSRFLTYPTERNPSLSANCNILSCLLHLPRPNEYNTQISKVSAFICDTWDAGLVTDKWSLVHLLKLLGNGRLLDVSKTLAKSQVPIVLAQIVVKLLRQQQSDGSWGYKGSSEETAYGLLSLKAIVACQWPPATTSKILDCIFLADSSLNWHKASYIWIEKVTYCSPYLSRAYAIAAMRCPIPDQKDGKPLDLHRMELPKIQQYASFLGALPLFVYASTWLLEESVVQSFLFTARLRTRRLEIFPQSDTIKRKYLAYIPMTWVTTNNISRAEIDNESLWEMMAISIPVYQADEYMEQSLLRNSNIICSQFEISSHVCVHKMLGWANRRLADDHRNLVISEVEAASLNVQLQLRSSITKFLLAHVTQIEDNLHLSPQTSRYKGGVPSNIPQMPYFDWVHSTSAKHTSCPFAFEFFACLIDDTGCGIFRSARQKYVANDVCQHLATMCRQYNDYSSVTRDLAESNLNSLDFLEFNDSDVETDGEDQRVSTDQASSVNDKKKEELMWLAEYERGSQKVGEYHGR